MASSFGDFVFSRFPPQVEHDKPFAFNCLYSPTLAEQKQSGFKDCFDARITEVLVRKGDGDRSRPATISVGSSRKEFLGCLVKIELENLRLRLPKDGELCRLKFEVVSIDQGIQKSMVVESPEILVVAASTEGKNK